MKGNITDPDHTYNDYISYTSDLGAFLIKNTTKVSQTNIQHCQNVPFKHVGSVCLPPRPNHPPAGIVIDGREYLWQSRLCSPVVGSTKAPVRINQVKEFSSTRGGKSANIPSCGCAFPLHSPSKKNPGKGIFCWTGGIAKHRFGRDLRGRGGWGWVTFCCHLFVNFSISWGGDWAKKESPLKTEGL